VLQSLDFATGKRVWSIDTKQKFASDKGFFGAVCSPLVENGRVLMNVGGPKGAGIVAFDAATGKTLWTATNDEAGYSAPVTTTINGTRHALFFTRAGLVDIDPDTGKIRFQFPWRSRSHASVNAAAPVVAGNLVFLSASYGTGATLLQIDASGAKQLWASDDALSSHYSTSVYRDGYLYGYHGRQEYGQSLRCVELKTGKVQWNVDGFGAGTVTLAGDRLIVVRENGELVLAPASPKEFKPAAHAQLLPAVVRAYPALADGKLYVRNEHTLACFGLK
jgi:outer membrane protein assembly factor BamB